MEIVMPERKSTVVAQALPVLPQLPANDQDEPDQMSHRKSRDAWCFRFLPSSTATIDSVKSTFGGIEVLGRSGLRTMHFLAAAWQYLVMPANLGRLRPVNRSLTRNLFGKCQRQREHPNQVERPGFDEGIIGKPNRLALPQHCQFAPGQKQNRFPPGQQHD